MNKLACPKCHQPMHLENRTYKCDQGHSYDIAKKQYINLLLNPDKASNNPGDSKDSLLCRREYLNQGYYNPICQSVIDCIEEYKDQDHPSFLDLGCGEGYYTQMMKQHFQESDVYGLDISKEAIAMATRYRKDITWIVGNSKNIPLLDQSLDFVSALFTVVNQDELKRVVKDHGYIIHVTANPHHLIEIKELIYDEIKVKSDKYIRLDFPVAKSYDLVKKISIDNREDALNLLKMTPHYYHIKKERRHVLDTLQGIDVTIDVKITVYQVLH